MPLTQSGQKMKHAYSTARRAKTGDSNGTRCHVHHITITIINFPDDSAHRSEANQTPWTKKKGKCVDT